MWRDAAAAAGPAERAEEEGVRGRRRRGSGESHTAAARGDAEETREMESALEARKEEEASMMQILFPGLHQGQSRQHPAATQTVAAMKSGRAWVSS